MRKSIIYKSDSAEKAKKAVIEAMSSKKGLNLGDNLCNVSISYKVGFVKVYVESGCSVFCGGVMAFGKGRTESEAWIAAQKDIGNQHPTRSPDGRIKASIKKIKNYEG